MAEPRLTRSQLHILLTLASAPSHGYGLLQAIETRTQGALRLGPSSLYYALGRLEDHGLVEETDEPDEGEPHEEQRRYFRLTGPGRERLQEEMAQMSALVDEARRLGMKPEGA